MIASCSIEGSDDSSIRDVTVNDLRPILEVSGLRRIFVNGKTALQLYRRYLEPDLGIPAVALPSTSPANAAWKTDALVRAWRRIRLPIGEKVTVTVDRPLGKRHPMRADSTYPVYCGYVEGVDRGDGEWQDAYVLGLSEPAAKLSGNLIAIVHRQNDTEDKWVVAPDGMELADEAILNALRFQEQYFQTELWR